LAHIHFSRRTKIRHSPGPEFSLSIRDGPIAYPSGLIAQILSSRSGGLFPFWRIFPNLRVPGEALALSPPPTFPPPSCQTPTQFPASPPPGPESAFPSPWVTCSHHQQALTHPLQTFFSFLPRLEPARTRPRPFIFSQGRKFRSQNVPLPLRPWLVYGDTLAPPWLLFLFFWSW